MKKMRKKGKTQKKNSKKKKKQEITNNGHNFSWIFARSREIEIHSNTVHLDYCFTNKEVCNGEGVL